MQNQMWPASLQTLQQIHGQIYKSEKNQEPVRLRGWIPSFGPGIEATKGNLEVMVFEQLTTFLENRCGAVGGEDS
jgi:hypothetical protein